MSRAWRAAFFAVSFSAPSLVQAAAGQVLFALGRVEIERGGQTLVAARGTPVEVGDTVRTGPTGLTQLRFKDGALLSLRHGSELQVQDFAIPPSAVPAAPASAAAVSVHGDPGTQGGARSVMRLVRGAFRTVTGLIGKSPADEYRVITPAATIGIRGTDYSVALCAGDCGGTPDGLYVGVSHGAIVIANDAGQLDLADNQYGYVRDAGSPPNQELAPPEVLEVPLSTEEGDDAEETEAPPTDATVGESGTTTESESDAAGWASAATGDVSVAEDLSMESLAAVSAKDALAPPPDSPFELQPGAPANYAFAAGAFRGAGDNGAYLDDAEGFTGFLKTVLVDIGSAQNVNQGFDESTGIRWGRWSGGVATVGDQPLDLTKQNLHWIYAPAPQAPVLPVSGTLNYSLVGNTNPTDQAGNVGFLGSARFTADFKNQTVTSVLDIAINNQTWNASGSGTIASGAPIFSGSYAVTLNQGGTGSGGFDGFFTNGGAGLSYHLSAGGTTLSGAAAFGDPTSTTTAPITAK